MLLEEHRHRAVLTQDQAIVIYTIRETTSCFGYQSLKSASLAKQFNVSPKTIRDIWNRRTWANETRHLWTEDERPMIRTKKQKSSLPSSPETHNSKAKNCDRGVPRQRIPETFFAHKPAATSAHPPSISFPEQHPLSNPPPAALSSIRLLPVALPPTPTPRPSSSPIADYTECHHAATAPSSAPPSSQPAAEPPLSTAWPWGPAAGAADSEAAWDAGIAAGDSNLNDPFHSDWPHW
jgi:hypothetical protein